MESPRLDTPTQRRPAISTEFYTLKEAAALVGVHYTTFWNWLKRKNKNSPPFRRFGGVIRIPKREFHRYLNGEK
jgi:excisionase family DNA binding protein